MMKKFKKNMLLPLCFSLLIPLTPKAVFATNIGVINTSYIFNNHPKFEDFRKEIEVLINKNKEDIANDEKKLSEMEKSLNDKIKRKYKQSIIKKESQQVEDIKTLIEVKKEKLRSREIELEQDLLKKVLEEIQQESERYAIKNNLDLVIDGSYVVYLKDKKEISDGIIKQIQEKVDNEKAKVTQENKGDEKSTENKK